MRATELGNLLKDASVRHVVVTGLAGDVCVKATALDAQELGFSVTVPLAATRFVNLQEGDDERAIAQLRAAGVDVTA
ncbi:isochorismatase family protein [Fodinicola feengrottensis]|uniref:isochorismatase family protein n=1 Tax=Fodinicola feengrottensis TaxID=435914 RepID=UPI0024422A9F|nr:isochorismatase family protein [Fodinicola feengrottensis]